MHNIDVESLLGSLTREQIEALLKDIISLALPSDDAITFLEETLVEYRGA